MTRLIATGLAVAGLLTALALAGGRLADDGDVALAPEPPPAVVTAEQLEAAHLRIDALDIELAAAAAALLLLQGQVKGQAADLAAARAAAAPAARPRARKRRPPDPPASSYLRLN